MMFFSRKIIGWVASSTLVVGSGGVVGLRWNAWFHNPEELPYEAPASPSRLLLTFGNEGELSRYVSWVCDMVVDANACLYLAQGEDTTRIEALGEVFCSRAGKAAYYRAHMCQLKPNSSYRYAVECQGTRSDWYGFSTTNPDSSDFSFLYMGDIQDTLGGITNQLLKEAVARHPEVEFAAFGGDLFERPMHSYFEEAFCSMDSICTSMPVINIPGNHDYLKNLVRSCERRFALTFPYFLKGMEERNDENHLAALHYHNTDFFLLDSNRELPFLWQQKDWLEEQLGLSVGANRIVLVHHPLYSVRRRNNNLLQRWTFADLIEKAAVNLVLQGHEHGYTHCTKEETPLTGNDCSNPPLYTVSHCSPKNYNLHPAERFYPVLSDSRYYQIVRVEGEIVTMLAYDANTGARVDSIRIVKK